MANFEQRLNLTAVVSICISSMLGSGIFVLPGLAVAVTGPSVWFAYFIAGICIVPAALSKAELATAMPSTGGTYIYVERTFGPFSGTLAGIGLWLSLLLKSAFALVGIGAYLMVFANFPIKTVALVLVFVIIALNILGVGKVSWVVTAVVLISLLSITGLVGGALFHVEPSNFQPFLPNGLDGLLIGAGMVFVSYAGVTKVAAIAEEIKQPEKNLPLGIMVSLLIVTTIYCSTTAVMVGVLPWVELSHDLKPIHTLANSIGGKTLGHIFCGVAILTMASMANAGVLAASRFPFAMSRDRLLPAFMGRLNSKFLTPVASIIVSGGTVAFVIATLDVEKIAKLASAFMLAIFAIENLAVIILRELRVHWYAPRFKSPMYPYIQIFGVLSMGYLLVTMGPLVVYAFVLTFVPGGLLFFSYARKRNRRKGVIGIRGVRRDLVQMASTDIKVEQDEISGQPLVVVALFGNERSPEMLVQLGAALAHGESLSVVHLTEVPEQTNIHDVHGESALVRSLRRRIRTMAVKNRINVDFHAILSHDIYRTVHAISSQLNCEWLVKEWGGKTHGAFTMHSQMGWLEDHLGCHVATFRDAGVRYIRKILVYVESGYNDILLVNTADHLAMVHEAGITFCDVLPEYTSKDVVLERTEYLKHLGTQCNEPAAFKLLRHKRPISAIVATSSDYDLLVIRASDYRSPLSRMIGNKEDKVIEKAACSVVAIQGVRA